MTSFVVENVSVPAEVEQAIDKRSSMAAIGSLNDYVKYQMGQGMAAGGTGGVAGVGAEMAVGMAMAQQMVNQPGGIAAQATKGIATPDAAPSINGGMPELLNPAQVAQMLGVAESDVLASLESGDIKGKKIGTQWRVPRTAVEAFLAS
jgi:excisionase family DNA binding protein